MIDGVGAGAGGGIALRDEECHEQEERSGKGFKERHIILLLGEQRQKTVLSSLESYRMVCFVLPRQIC
jgi:hypothetical protein